MSDVSGVDNLTANSSGSSALTGLKSAVDNLNSDKQEKAGGAVTGHLASFGASNVLQDSGKTAPSGAIVGDTDTQTLTGKTISGANNTLTVREADLATTDVTTGNASASKHGLLPKLSGVSTDVLRGDGTFGAPSSGIKSFTADENISANDAVAVGDGGSYTLASSSGGATNEAFFSGTWYSQKFTTSPTGKQIVQITVQLRNTTGSAQSGTANASIRADSAGQPTGADLATATAAYSINDSTTGTVTFTFALSVSASTSYHLIIKDTGLNFSGNFFVVRSNTASTGTNKSTNSGSTWAANNGALNYTVSEIHTTAARIYRASTLVSTCKANAFVGFAAASISSGVAGNVTLLGVVSGFTSLTPGATYYLSDTYGAVSTSAGTNSRKIGLAVSTTEILIKSDNP